MVTINLKNLNELERNIHDKLTTDATSLNKITINDAAAMCNVSTSKISKYVRKIGFTSFKQYLNYYSGNIRLEKNTSSELERIKNYIENFDESIVDNFIEEYEKYDQIIFYGFGPSQIACEYFKYRLQIISNKFIFVASDETSLVNLANKNSLVVFVTLTSTFISFKEICEKINNSQAKIIFLIGEYSRNKELDDYELLYLTNNQQDNALKAYEKSRTVFFIFFEEVIQKIISNN